MTTPVAVKKFDVKSHDSPDELRAPQKTRVEVVRLEGFTLSRFNFEPGWRWSECIKPVVKTESCQASHVGYAVSGRITVRLNDGTEKAIVAGQSYTIPPGHDAWVEGNERFVGIEVMSAEQYAKPKSRSPGPPPQGGTTMRRIMNFASIFSILFFLPLSAFAQARPPLKVGLLLPYSGVFTVQGQDATRGFEQYLAKIGGRAGGREFQLLKEDTEVKPDVGLTKARKLVERDRVDALVGPVSSAVALTIRDYVHGRGIPLIVPIAFTRDLTAPPKASPWIFRVVETTDQGNFAMGTWVYTKTPYRKLVIMASDFVAGRHSVEAFIAAFRQAGGEIVKEIYPPLNTPDFAPYLAQVGGLGADAVYTWFAGADAIRYVRAYKEYGLAGKLPLLGYNTLVDDIILPALGDTALGIVSVGHYSAAVDTPGNRAFVKEYEARYNAWPSRYVELGYVAAQLIAAAADTLKGEVGDRAKFRDAIRSVVTDIQPPRGPIQFDRYQQVITDVYVTKVERQGNRLVNAVVDRIPRTSQEESWKWWHK